MAEISNTHSDSEFLAACRHCGSMNPDEVTSHHYEYLGNGRVLASLTTESGTVRFVMTAVMFLEAMRLANECMNANLRPVLRDIGVF